MQRRQFLMLGAAATSTFALTNATLPYLVELATRGPKGAAAVDPALISGLNTMAHRVVNPAVAEALRVPAAPLPELLDG